ncbi:hypothetical protein JW756_02235 [Candidatus Woesearchaeota archaeon]|nr:hypothetical protein [Candidatus Woesearchaeota archaeon]
MARKKGKEQNNSVFEIIVVLAIVAIVAVTGQVLIHYEGGSSSGATALVSRDLITGNVVAEQAAPEETPFLDIGVKSIEVNPPSPIIGEAFEIKVNVVNNGFVKIDTPFYVQIELLPSGGDIQSTKTQAAMTKVLEPGEDSVAVFNILTVTKEGPLKIIATADSTVKLDDQNPSNNQMSKTIIINTQ